MTGILDWIRATTPETLAGVTGNFSDLPTAVYTPRMPKNMIRTVEGADDLKVTRPAPVAPGMSKVSDWSDKPEIFTRDEDDRAADDKRSDGQVRYMDNLIMWIAEKDEAAGHAARVWTDNVTTAGKWSWDKADKFSISGWIDRLKAKNAELKAIPAPVEEMPEFQGVLPAKADKNGKPMALRYAVEIEGELKFYRIKPGRKDGFYLIDAQASDEFHSIRNAATKATIIKAIMEAGPEACMARYGQEIGSCGRCGITLTDADSRARGIGPDCWGKM